VGEERGADLAQPAVFLRSVALDPAARPFGTAPRDLQAARPGVQTAMPEVQTALPEVQAVPPEEVRTALPEVQTALPEVPAALPEDVGSLIRRGRHALNDLGDLNLSRRWFELACRTAERAHDEAALAEAAIGLGGLWVHEHRSAADRARVQSWQSRAAASAPAGSSEHLLLRTRLTAEIDYLTGRPEPVLALLDEARQRNEPHTLAPVLSLVHHCLLGPQHAAFRVQLAQEMLMVAARTERRLDRLVGLLWRSVDLFLEADPQARRSFTELTAELAHGDHLAISFVTQAMQVMLAIRAGSFERAERLAMRCFEAGERCGDADAASWYSGQLLGIRWFQGRVTDLAPMLRGRVNAPELSAIDEAHIAALAVAAAVAGEHREAAGALARLGRGDLTNVRPSSVWLVTLYGAVEAAAILADRETAATAYALLEPFAGLPMMGSLAATCFGSVEHALGVASLTTGHLDRAITHLRRAVRANLALEHWPAACLSRYRLAQALAHRGDPADAAAAAGERQTAIDEAGRLGMRLPADLAIAAAAPRTPVVREGANRVPRVARFTASPSSDRDWPVRTDSGARPAPPAWIRLLGPLEISVAGVAHPVLGHRRRTVLAVLALQAGEIVSMDRLIDIVWGDRPPRTAVNTVQSHVSYLRRVIGARSAIVGRPPGYLLDLGAEATDVMMAERLIQAATRTADPAERARQLVAALALWRGRPLADVTASPWLELQAERLNHLLLQAHQMLAEARLALGENSQLAVELRPLTREHPLAERLHGYLMLALYREGRQSEALEVYRRLRTVLSAELGVEPTEPLRALQLAILRQDAVVAVH
jgi:DNA-binding SARP family transcriptional activator